VGGIFRTARHPLIQREGNALLSPLPMCPPSRGNLAWIWLRTQILLAWIRLTYGRRLSLVAEASPIGPRSCWSASTLDSRDRVPSLSMRGAGLRPTWPMRFSGADLAPAFVQLHLA